MELRQNWHKFHQILGPLPPKKPGVVVLHSNNTIVAGAVGIPNDSPMKDGFEDVGAAMENVDAMWDKLSHKYGAVGSTFIDREELVNALGQVASVRTGSPATDNFYSQLKKLRAQLGVDRNDKQKLAQHFGDRPVDAFWPREHFLFSLFRCFLGELFPDRKLLLLGVVNDTDSVDAMLLEFQGHELKGFCDPSFSGLDWKGMDLFLPENVARFVLWAETHFVLPTYAVFITRRIWEECREAQSKGGEKAAWKHLLKMHSARDVEREVIFEPNPWPVKAILRWHAMRG